MQLVTIAVKLAKNGEYLVKIKDDVFGMVADKLMLVNRTMPDTPSLGEEVVPLQIRLAVSTLLPMYLD
jgi:hypothetical protein